MKFERIPDNQVPEKSAFGQPRNPLDEEFADWLEDHPGQWYAYPLAERWPHLWDNTPEGFDNCARRLAGAISNGRGSRNGHKKPTGAYVTDEGHFDTRRDRDHLRMLVRLTPHPDAEDTYR